MTERGIYVLFGMINIKRSWTLWRKKKEKNKHVNVSKEIGKANSFLIRTENTEDLAYAFMFASKLAKEKKKVKILIKEERLVPLRDKFDLFLYKTNIIGDKEWKALSQALKGDFKVYIDFSNTPSLDIAAVLDAGIRIACGSRELAPFFNVIISAEKKYIFYNMLIDMFELDDSLPDIDKNAKTWIQDKDDKQDEETLIKRVMNSKGYKGSVSYLAVFAIAFEKYVILKEGERWINLKGEEVGLEKIGV